jgi:hypothetical protein
VEDPRNDLPEVIREKLTTQLKGADDQIVYGWLGYENLGG